MNLAGLRWLLIEPISEQVSDLGFDFCVFLVTSSHFIASVFAQFASNHFPIDTVIGQCEELFQGDSVGNSRWH